MYKVEYQINEEIFKYLDKLDRYNVINKELINKLISDIPIDKLSQLFNIKSAKTPIFTKYTASIDVDEILNGGWVKYNFMDINSRPPISGKYFIIRKDGKTHWETWNGNGFAYNNNEIRYWKRIKLPVGFIPEVK